MPRLKLFLLLYAICCVGIQCAWGEDKRVPPSHLKIGAILTLSGSFASAGDDSRRGIEAALASRASSHRLHIVYADSRNEPSSAISEYQKLLSVDRVAAIYTHRSSIGMALNPIALRDQVPLIGAVGHQDFAAGNSLAVQAWPRAHDEGAFLAEELLRRNLRRIAILYTEDEWTSTVTEGFRSTLGKLGVTPVFDQVVLPGEQDFRTQLLKLKSSAPEAVYFNLLLPQIAPALRQAREMTIPGVLFSNFYAAKKEVRDAAGVDSLEGLRYVELDNDLPNLKKALGRDEPPPGLAVAAYVSTILLLQAIEAEPSPSNASQLMASLLHQKEVKTSDGSYKIEERCIKFPLVVKVMKNGAFIKDAMPG